MGESPDGLVGDPAAPTEGPRPVSENALARWLVLHGLAEDVRGYGHVTGDDLAAALVAKFDIHRGAGYARP